MRWILVLACFAALASAQAESSNGWDGERRADVQCSYIASSISTPSGLDIYHISIDDVPASPDRTECPSTLDLNSAAATHHKIVVQYGDGTYELFPTLELIGSSSTLTQLEIKGDSANPAELVAQDFIFEPLSEGDIAIPVPRKILTVQETATGYPNLGNIAIFDLEWTGFTPVSDGIACERVIATDRALFAPLVEISLLDANADRTFVRIVNIVNVACRNIVSFSPGACINVQATENVRQTRLNLLRSEFSNISSPLGGALFTRGLMNVEFSENMATNISAAEHWAQLSDSCSGSVVFAELCDDVVMLDNQISDVTASTSVLGTTSIWMGGAIGLSAIDTLYCGRNTFDAIRTSGRGVAGGVIFIQGITRATIESNIFSNYLAMSYTNEAGPPYAKEILRGAGGAIYVEVADEVLIENCTFREGGTIVQFPNLQFPGPWFSSCPNYSLVAQTTTLFSSFNYSTPLGLPMFGGSICLREAGTSSTLDPSVRNCSFFDTNGLSFFDSDNSPTEIFGTDIAIDQSGAEIVGNVFSDVLVGMDSRIGKMVYSPIAIVSPRNVQSIVVIEANQIIGSAALLSKFTAWDVSKGIVHVEALPPTSTNTGVPLKITANQISDVFGGAIFSIARPASQSNPFSYVQVASNAVTGNIFDSYVKNLVGAGVDMNTEIKLYCNTVAGNQVGKQLFTDGYPLRVFSNFYYRNNYTDDFMDPSIVVSHGYNLFDTEYDSSFTSDNVSSNLAPSDFSNEELFILSQASEFAGFSTPSVFNPINLNNCVTTYLDAAPRNIYFLTPGAFDVPIPTCAVNPIDFDSDLVCDFYEDNCFLEANVNQEDGDNDGLGDICDPDPDCFRNVNCVLTTEGTECEKEVPSPSDSTDYSILVKVVPEREIGTLFFTTDTLEFTCVPTVDCTTAYAAYTADRSVIVTDGSTGLDIGCTSGMCEGADDGDPPDVSLVLSEAGLTLKGDSGPAHVVNCYVVAFDLEGLPAFPAVAYAFEVDLPPVTPELIPESPNWIISETYVIDVAVNESAEYTCTAGSVSIWSCTPSGRACDPCDDKLTSVQEGSSVVLLWTGDPPRPGCESYSIELLFETSCTMDRRQGGIPYGVILGLSVNIGLGQVEISSTSGTPTTFLPTTDLIIPSTLFDPNGCSTNDATLDVVCDSQGVVGCACSSAIITSSINDLTTNGEISIAIPNDSPELGCDLDLTVSVALGCGNGWTDPRLEDNFTISVEVNPSVISVTAQSSAVDWNPEEDLLVAVVLSDPNGCGEDPDVLVVCNSVEAGCGCADVQGSLQSPPDGLGNAMVQIDFGSSQNYPDAGCVLPIDVSYVQSCGPYGVLLSLPAQIEATIFFPASVAIAITEDPGTWNVAAGPLQIPVVLSSEGCVSGAETVGVTCVASGFCDCNLQDVYDPQLGAVVVTALAPFPQSECSLELIVEYSKVCSGGTQTAQDSTIVIVVLDDTSISILDQNEVLEWTPTISPLVLTLLLDDPNDCPDPEVVTATCTALNDPSSCACSFGSTSLGVEENGGVRSLSLTIGSDLPEDGCMVSVTTTYSEACSAYTANPLVAVDSTSVAIRLPQLQLILLNGAQVAWNPLEVLPLSYELIVPDECSGPLTVSAECSSSLPNCDCTIITSPDVENSILELSLQSPFPSVGCELIVTVTAEQQDCYQGSTQQATDSLVAIVTNETPLPLPVFDSSYSYACTAYSSDSGLFIRLNPPTGSGSSEIESYTWSTSTEYLCNPEEFNCGGGTQDNFIFIPPDSLDACTTFFATVVQNPIPNSGYIASEGRTCSIIPRPPPTSGTCIAIRNSFPPDLPSDCVANNGDIFTLACEGFQAQSCGNAGLGELVFGVEQQIGTTSSSEWVVKADATHLGDGSFSMELGAPRVLRVRARDGQTGAEAVGNEVDVRICYETVQETTAYIGASLDGSAALLEQGNVEQASSLVLEASLALQEITNEEDREEQAELVQESINRIVEELQESGGAVDTSEAIAAVAVTATAVCDEENVGYLLEIVESDASEFNTAVAATSLGAAASSCSASGTSDELLNDVLSVQDNIRVRVASDPKTCESPSILLSDTDSYSYAVYSTTGEEFQNGAVFSVEGVTFSFPECFGNIFESILQTTFGIPDLRLSSVSCVTVHTAVYDVVCEDACSAALVSDLASFDFFVVLPGEEEATIVEVEDLPADCGFLVRLPRDEGGEDLADGGGRFVLAEDGDSGEGLVCGYQVPGEGFTFELDGCRLFNESELDVICECFHLSNFGALFDSGNSNDDWTAIRITSLVLLFVTWLLLFIFFLLVMFSDTFVLFFNLETRTAKDRRILGDQETDSSL